MVFEGAEKIKKKLQRPPPTPLKKAFGRTARSIEIDRKAREEKKKLAWEQFRETQG